MDEGLREILLMRKMRVNPERLLRNEGSLTMDVLGFNNTSMGLTGLIDSTMHTCHVGQTKMREVLAWQQVRVEMQSSLLQLIIIATSYVHIIIFV